MMRHVFKCETNTSPRPSPRLARRGRDNGEMSIEEKYRLACQTPSDIFEHLPTLRRYAEQCETVTELGVRGIVSTWAFLAGLLQSRVQNRGPQSRVQSPESTVRSLESGARLVSVDMFHPRAAGGDLDEAIGLAKAEGIGFVFLLGNDLEIELPATDLLFIDTWHVYEQLKKELELHASKAKEFIILHDTETFGLTGETPGHRGLRPAVDEFLGGAYGTDGIHWKVREHFTNCNGLTVLERRA